MARSRDELWRVYELIFKHYENEMNIYWTRGNFFLVVQTGLFAFVSQAQTRSAGVPMRGALTACFLGFVIALLWLAVLISTLAWITHWRNALIAVDAAVNPQYSVGRSFSRETWGPWKQRLAWLARPSRIALAMPACFLAALAYLGVAAMLSPA